MSVHVGSVVSQVTMGQVFLDVLLFSPVRMSHIDIYLQFAFTRMTNGRSWGIIKRKALSEISEHWIDMYFRLFSLYFRE